MKRTPLKRGKVSLKRTKLKKKSKTKIGTLQRKLWLLCKGIIRKKHGNVCYTCGAMGLIGLNWHTGHLWSKASLSAYLKYDLRVLRPQCYSCNINRGGMGADFYLKMLKEIGEEAMQKLQEDRKILIKADESFYLAKIEEYQNKLNQLTN